MTASQPTIPAIMIYVIAPIRTSFVDAIMMSQFQPPCRGVRNNQKSINATDGTCRAVSHASWPPPNMIVPLTNSSRCSKDVFGKCIWMKKL